MSDRSGTLDRSAAELILSVAETPDATITASALSGYYGRLAPVLQESGLLRPRHHQRVAVSIADHDDEPVNLVWSPEHRGYGYFSASAGWVTVSGEQLAVYGVDFGELFRRLLHGLDLPPKRAPDMLVPDLLWEAELQDGQDDDTPGILSA